MLTKLKVSLTRSWWKVVYMLINVKITQTRINHFSLLQSWRKPLNKDNNPSCCWGISRTTLSVKNKLLEMINTTKLFLVFEHSTRQQKALFGRAKSANYPFDWECNVIFAVEALLSSNEQRKTESQMDRMKSTFIC